MQCLRVGVGLSEASTRGTLGSLPVRLQPRALRCPPSCAGPTVCPQASLDTPTSAVVLPVQNPSTLQKLSQEPAGQGSWDPIRNSGQSHTHTHPNLSQS